MGAIRVRRRPAVAASRTRVERDVFKVKWIDRFGDKPPIAIEDSVFTNLDDIVEQSKDELYARRLSHMRAPDGFIVCDEDGAELRRWIGPYNADAEDPGDEAA